MPVALSADRPPPLSLSSCDRSRPLVFLTAVFAFLGADRPGVLFSSSASSASRSAFFRASSAFFAASASLVVAQKRVSGHESAMQVYRHRSGPGTVCVRAGPCRRADSSGGALADGSQTGMVAAQKSFSSEASSRPCSREDDARCADKKHVTHT